MVINFRYNRYDIYLFLLIILQVFGGYGGSLQPVRLFVILSFPFIVFSTIYIDFVKFYTYEIVFMIFFFLYGLLLVYKVEDILFGIKEISYIFLYALMFISVSISSVNSINPKRSIVLGWTVLFIITLPFALYEIVFDWHFSNSTIEAGTIVGGIGGVKRFAGVTFGNFNQYNVILIYSLPFLLTFYFLKPKLKAYNLIILLVFTFIVFVNSSRGAMLCLIISLGYVFLSNFKSSFKYILIILFFTYVSGEVLKKLYFSEYFAETESSLSYLIQDNTRLDLINRGLELLSESNFFGIGPGNIQNLSFKIYGTRLTASHNLFIEILVQYGILVFIGFLYLLFRIFQRIKYVDNYSRIVLIIFILTFPISSIINSNYLSGTYLWIFIISMVLISNPYLKPLSK